ncbi:hypothetical protein [Ruegeria sp.]|uniref:hypothetical protein n=1 Tax=Ruegeria sp. TaxID=1879320 RepID=UPI003C7D5ED2
MSFIKRCSTAAFASLTLSICAPLSVLAQEQSAEGGQTEIIIETFEGEDQSLMLGGQIFFNPSKSDWVIYVSDGDLVMENRKSPQSLHFNDVAWVKFPETDSIESTENMVISAVVESGNEAQGGAGVLVGSGKSGKYLALAVDGQGRFHVLKKDGRQLRAVHSAKHDVINVGEANEVSFQVRGAHVLFFVNGVKVIQVPYSKRSTNSRNDGGGTGIGLAAFGLGIFRFDQVEITRAN